MLSHQANEECPGPHNVGGVDDVLAQVSNQERNQCENTQEHLRNGICQSLTFEVLNSE